MISWRKIAVEITFVLVIVGVVTATSILYKSPTNYVPVPLPQSDICPPRTPFTNNNNQTGVQYTKSKLSDSSGEFVGLSDGDFTFNILGPDGVLKCRASAALKQGHAQDAEALWTQALHIQSNDAETLIYQENQRVLDAKQPYINLVIGTILTGNTIGNSLDVLQGAYTAQKRYNQDHAGGLQVRLLIANFGNNLSFASQVARQIVAAAAKDDRIDGMMGLPTEVKQPDILSELAQTAFPIVLPTGSTGSQEEQQNFFHISSSTVAQGELAAQYVEKDCPNLSKELPTRDCRGQNIVVFMDDGSPYSYTMGQAFVKRINTDAANNRTSKSATTRYYKTGDTNSIIEQIQSMGNSAPALIYFAGNADDANTFLKNLPQTSAFANMRVLGGDALYQPASYNAGLYNRLNITVFAYPDEWGILRPGQDQRFFCDYARDFAGGKLVAPQCDYGLTSSIGRIGYGYNRADNQAMLSYDALSVILNAIDTATASSNGIPTPGELLNAIKNINTSQPYKGVSGRIAFDASGNPVDKAILVLRIDELGQTKMQGQYGTF